MRSPDEHDPATAAPAVDREVIEQLAGITDAEGFSVLGELLGTFLSTASARLAALTKAVHAGDTAQTAHDAHALAGSAASFGASGMNRLSRELKVLAEGGDLGASDELVRRLQLEFVRVRAALGPLTASSRH